MTETEDLELNRVMMQLGHKNKIQTAARVAKLVFDSGLARVNRPADVVAFIREHVYKPKYHSGVTPTTKAA
ncbi:MAG: NAD-dependent malic enzyme [Edaphobacter sp.]|nr:NAD-dependent malic enzyme [Edaphobacter sp.]